MRSVEDNSKLTTAIQEEEETDDDEEKEKQQNIPKSNAKVIEETRRLLPNPSLLHGRKSKDVDEWLDEMKFYAWKSRGIPESRRKELWLTLAEKYFRSKCINWPERRSNSMYVEDRDMEDQIIKDLHRTGSAFCSGPNSIINQGKLKHLLLEYAQWNPKVGYCQGFNVLGAFILQIMEKEQENSLKIMVYLLEGVLPPGYYSESLMGLQIDMAVFRQLMFEQLPMLATHVQNLETGQGFDEPPLTNLFTMQWFLTIFCTCLSMPTLLRVWDLIFLEGNEIIFRTSLAIWSIMERYVTKMNSIDDFYGNMGILFQRLCSGSMCDPAELIRIVSRFKPILNLHVLRVKHKQQSERNKRPHKSNQKGALPSSSNIKNINNSEKMLREANKKVNLTNIDMSVFKKQYEKLKRRPSLELNASALSRKSLDASFSVNKFWSNNINNNNNNNKPINSNNKKLINSIENKKENLVNINKHHKKIENNLVQHHRHMKSKKSPDIKQFPKPEQLDSLINNKEESIQSSDSSSTTSLCDNDDNDDDSLYECSSLNYYYSDSIDETCDNWPNIEIKNSEKTTTSENVNLILEQIASYSTSNNMSDIICKTDNVLEQNDIDDDDDDVKVDNQQSHLLLEVTKLPDTENICDENNYEINCETKNKNDEILYTEDKTISEKFNFKEIEKWREKYLKSPPEKTSDNPPILEDAEKEMTNIPKYILNFESFDIHNEETSMENNSLLETQLTNSTENQNLIKNSDELEEKDIKLKDMEDKVSTEVVTSKSDKDIRLESDINTNKEHENESCDTRSNNHFQNETSDISSNKDVQNETTDTRSNKDVQNETTDTNSNKHLQNDTAADIAVEGVTNEIFDNLFQNKFSQFAKYAVKDYLEGIHYSFEEDGETTKTDTRTYYDVFKIIEENSKVLDSFSKKSNNIIISPADSSDNIQQESDKSDDMLKSGSLKDEDLNDSLSDIKTIKENQGDLTAADEISSSECNSASLKIDGIDIVEKSNNIELKIDTFDEIAEESSKGDLDYQSNDKNFDNDFLSDRTYFQQNRMSRSFEDKTEHERDVDFVTLKVVEKESSKSMEHLEGISQTTCQMSTDLEEKEDFEKPFLEDKDKKEQENKISIEEIKNEEKEDKDFSKTNSSYDNQEKEYLNEEPYVSIKNVCDKKENIDTDTSKSFEILEDNILNDKKKHFKYEDYSFKDTLSDGDFKEKENQEKTKITKNIHEEENDYESKRFKRIQDKEPDDTYDQYWYIEKPEQIEKRRDSLRKSISPIDSLKDSLLDSPNSMSSKELTSSSSSYKYDKAEDLLSKIRSTNLDEFEYKERKTTFTRPSSIMSSDKTSHSNSKSVRIFESPKEQIGNKYSEYKKESNYNNLDDDYSVDKSKDTAFNRYKDDTINEDDKNSEKINSTKSLYESQTYDRKYFSCKDESEFKERLESIKNTIKFIDDLCDENDKITRRKGCNRDSNARKSLIFDDLLSKTPNSINNTDNRYNNVTKTPNSSDQCSNIINNNNKKYNHILEIPNNSSPNSLTINVNDKNLIFKKNSSYENLNVQNENQKSDYMYSSVYENKISDDTKENIDFESIEKRKSKSYSNIYFSKIE